VQYPDATQIERIIGISSLCADCIVRRTGMHPWRLTDALPRLIGALRVASAIGPCAACAKQRVVHRLA
jgi:hypothetical protein